jgi:hypothetical protein
MSVIYEHRLLSIYVCLCVYVCACLCVCVCVCVCVVCVREIISSILLSFQEDDRPVQQKHVSF